MRKHIPKCDTIIESTKSDIEFAPRGRSFLERNDQLVVMISDAAPAAAPAVEAVSAAAPSVDAAPPSASVRGFLNAVAGQETRAVGLPGELPPPTAVSTMPSNPAVGDAFERRLQRLEKMVEKILVQKQVRPDNNAISRAQAPAAEGLTFSYTIRDSQSLADLKKLRIDIEEEMANLQHRLHDLDNQITKLESERTGKRTPLRSSTK